ncbi:MAG: hypothetical protein ACM3IJ_05120 [Candidatus Levyibacteriota bacterium]
MKDTGNSKPAVKKTNLPLIFLVCFSILMLTIFATIIVYLIKNSSKPSLKPTLSITPSTKTENLNTSNGETYTSSSIDITFQYPNDWEIQEYSKTNNTGLDLGPAPYKIPYVSIRNDGGKIAKPKNFKQVTIGNGISAEFSSEFDCAAPTCYRYRFSHNGKDYLISRFQAQKTEYDSAFNQILSTFKFTQ